MMKQTKEPVATTSIYKKIKNSIKHLFTGTKITKESEGSQRSAAFNEVIESYIQNMEDFSPQEKKILQNCLSFGDKKVEEIMVPRFDIQAVHKNIEFKDLLETLTSRTHTRLPIYEDSLDNIIGFVHLKDLLQIIAKNEKYDINNILRKIPAVAPSMKITDLLLNMQKTKTHIAIVIDEYGGTDGLVTIENVMEEIVGDINDEHDSSTNDNYIKPIDNGTWVVSSRIEIEELEDYLNTSLPKPGEGYETLGGLILTQTGYVPTKGTIIKINESLKAEILAATPRTINSVKLTRIN